MSKKRVLVTGAYGFVGANLVRKLVQSGHEVVVAVRPTTSNWRLADISDSFRAMHPDIADIAGLTADLKALRPEWIFHMAAHGAYPEQTSVQEIFATNTTGIVSLLEAAEAAGASVFVNAGSSSEYGYYDHAPREDEALLPNSPYAVSKAAATMYGRYFAERSSMKIATARLYSVYGPYEEPTRLIPTVIRCGREKGYPPLVGPDTARDFVWVHDVVDGLLELASNAITEKGAVFNFATGKQTTLRNVAALAREIFSIEVEPEWETMEARAWDTNCWVGDSSKAKIELGLTFSTGFAQGLKMTAEWYEANPNALAKRVK